MTSRNNPGPAAGPGKKPSKSQMRQKQAAQRAMAAASGARSARNKQLLQVGGAVLAVLVVVGIFIAVYAGQNHNKKGNSASAASNAVTQAVTVAELVQANPALRPLALYRSAMRVGRAHIASVINTIILAYAGASLPVLLLITAYNQSLAVTLTSQFLAQEIVRSIVGTLGLIAAVPITTALASLTARPVLDRRPWLVRLRTLRHAAPAPYAASALRPSLKIKNEGEQYEALLFRPGQDE